MAWDQRYMQLKEGDVVKEGDEFLDDDTLQWKPVVNSIGRKAANPAYTSHQWYRRIKGETK